MENAARIKCTACEWDLVWHQFGLLDDKSMKCEMCGSEVTILPATVRDITRLGLDVVRGNVVPESKHYSANGFCRSLSIF